MRELNSGRRGANAVVIFLVLEASWLTSPQKERKSVRLLGVGKLAMASVISELIEYPSEVSSKPDALLAELELISIQ